MPFRSILDQAHHLLHEAAAAAPPDNRWGVDATVGNGHDTAFLAETLGPNGHVIGFDVQKAALEATTRRLANRQLADRVTLHHVGHEHMAAHLPADAHHALCAVAFNLGYLPRHDHAIITRPATTVAALQAAAAHLRIGGRISVVCYTGHAGGPDEAAAVQSWAAALPPDAFEVLDYRFVNQRHAPPRLVVVERISS
ncbi:tRNA (mnm(5)s(2)U34)-methyltransferase [Salisaeta longa]|uniref:tRNA (mnm(5)s(2)U34)-methyltransferase n=1 Tax=Salisaeta longa TaxID=503170 RepID=UPI0003B54FA7|nr:class I SAM-dependent methyltransferase [Salisaeta longa]